MTDEQTQGVSYLQGKTLTAITVAAKMAGLRWKNGALDKAGIIQQLAERPAVLRAAIATLQRMERTGDQAPKVAQSFMDDIEEEKQSEPTPLPAPSEPTEPVKASPDIDRAIQGLSGRVERLEGYAISKAQAGVIAQQTLAPFKTTVEAEFSSIKAEIEALQKRRPIEIHIPDRKTIQIDPATAHKSYPKLLTYLQINRRVILTGSAGTGKSMAVKNAAKDLGLEFYLQPPFAMAHEAMGHKDANGHFHQTPLFQAYVKGGVCLVDEADSCSADALLPANPVFDGNGFAVFGDGNLWQQHPDFIAVFNMNTDGNGATMQYPGRTRLDGATIARFGVRIHWDIDPRIESAMAGAFPEWQRVNAAVRELMASRGIVDVNATPRHVKTGAALLAANCPRVDVLEDCLKNGALSEVWADVLRLPAVISFLKG